jgi:hypothetical protein
MVSERERRAIRFWKIDVVLCGISIVLVAACLMWLQRFPSVALGDAWAYHAYALQFRERGFLSEIGSIRTYGYPTFLYMLSFMSDSIKIPLFAGLVQYLLYAIVSLWLARRIRRENVALSYAVLAGLLVNPYLISIVSDCFSDSLLVPIFVLLTCLAVAVAKARTIAAVVGSLGAGALGSTFALMVRPAAIPVMLAWNAAAVIGIVSNSWLRERCSGKYGSKLVFGRTQTILLYTALLAASAAITWGPQMYYNYSTWHDVSVLPVCRLGEIQIFYSIAMLRYDTVVSDSGATQFFVANPFSTTEIVVGHPIGWYLSDLARSLKTISLRFLSGLSVDHLFNNVQSDAYRPFGVAILTLYWTIMCLGIARACASLGAVAKHCVKQRGLAGDYLAAITFVTLSTFGIIILNSFTAVELRFNTFVIGVFCVLGVDAVLSARSGAKLRRRALHGLAGGLLLTICSEVILLRYGTTKLGNVPQVTLSPLKCYTFTWEAPVP